VKAHYLYFLYHNLKTRLLRQRVPLLAGFKITHQCNLQCRSCPFWKKKPEQVTYPQALEIFEKLRRAGIRLLIFEGGEPFLWRDGRYRLEDLVRAAKQFFFSVGITTNGTLPIETTATSVWVSIDGLETTHNQNRGDNFNRVLQNLTASRHPNLMANITINRLNYPEIPELVRFLNDKVQGITIQFYYPFPDSEDLWLSRAQRIQVLEQLILLKNKGFRLLNSVTTLEALKENTWKCHPWLIGSVEPNGEINYGCYLFNRAEISCAHCGFAAHTELSQAFDWNPASIWAGRKIFKFKMLAQ
jgi:MoaA/NifB/PqqE/SkfB family radical SAM enzyme